MTISKAIANDLLAVYLAGEASEETRRAVEEFARRDPEFARLLIDSPATRLPDSPVFGVAEVRALERTRRALARRSWLMGIAIFLTLLPLSILVKDGEVKFLLVRDAPSAAAAISVAAAGAWAGYFRARVKV
ncbi:MAG: hypothetical protein SFV18_02350 [Bryobacteraceae bacterium]|nr:hypothetical protein [Bryobacteraceae bacterium]